jgi:hypothetical protein
MLFPLLATFMVSVRFFALRRSLAFAAAMARADAFGAVVVAAAEDEIE